MTQIQFLEIVGFCFLFTLIYTTEFLDSLLYLATKTVAYFTFKMWKK